ncbi:rhodanese-like domain-containing protein [Thalassorhabdus alkalitolerans]|uniref:Rhodanese-like domain-containing protein n=1 Tax=Thalassorhabdus alkalitolerans TaxID=2282697 RepID=A0ABW0YLC5_9BACI|nr:rhodanese-like domain-containing protein [Thalassobacillus sp. C254]
MSYDLDGVEQLDYAELKEIFDQKKSSPILIDVREPEEYIERHIPNVPLIPMQSIPERIEEFHKDAEYIFICRSGTRSHHVALYFKDNGIENVKNFAGGMLAWESETESGWEGQVRDIEGLYSKQT